MWLFIYGFIALLVFVVVIDINVYIKQRKYILEPIQQYVSVKTEDRGRIVNTINAYRRCSDQELVVQKHLLRAYTEKSSIVDKVTDLFAKLMFPLMTFILLFAMTWLVSLFEITSSNLDKTKLSANISEFQDIVLDLYREPLALLLTLISGLILASISAHFVAQKKSNLILFHEDIIHRLIKERNIEATTIDGLSE
ncbi:hypothetical protein [Paenibacillus alvei]|uniref:Uncharacterized protein n=1 Tax=Paenibacillus alvei TaxID=44250 RepID=A0AAP7A286_PAEAL|nr:hypothetical protein [Paenibacillus alvei]NOJ74126.1 hypothetical protein [Paenibacillus alvei]